MNAHRDGLATDGSAIGSIAATLERLLGAIRHEAAQASDGATSEALVTLADDLRDALHGPMHAALKAHEDACDEAGIESCISIEVSTSLALGLPVTSEVARAELERAVAGIGETFAAATARRLAAE